MRLAWMAIALGLSLPAVAAAQNALPRPGASLNTPRPGVAARGGLAGQVVQVPNAPVCSGHGQLVTGLCACSPGWSGNSCQAPAGSICNGHGTMTANGGCICSTFWMGPACSIPGLSITGPVFPQ